MHEIWVVPTVRKMAALHRIGYRDLACSRLLPDGNMCGRSLGAKPTRMTAWADASASCSIATLRVFDPETAPPGVELNIAMHVDCDEHINGVPSVVDQRSRRAVQGLKRAVFVTRTKPHYHGPADARSLDVIPGYGELSCRLRSRLNQLADDGASYAEVTELSLSGASFVSSDASEADYLTRDLAGNVKECFEQFVQRSARLAAVRRAHGCALLNRAQTGRSPTSR